MPVSAKPKSKDTPLHDLMVADRLAENRVNGRIIPGHGVEAFLDAQDGHGGAVVGDDEAWPDSHRRGLAATWRRQRAEAHDVAARRDSHGAAHVAPLMRRDELLRHVIGIEGVAAAVHLEKYSGSRPRLSPGSNSRTVNAGPGSTR